MIGNPLQCNFDPSELACSSGPSQGCLTAKQVETARKIYAGPMTSRGEKLWLGGPLPGSEYSGRQGQDWRELLGVEPHLYSMLTPEGFRYLFFMPEPGPTWQLGEFDFDRDYKRHHADGNSLRQQ